MVTLKATTIIETVIAMVIILLVFLVAGTIFLNISKAGVSEKRIMASEIANNYLNQIKIDKIPDEITESNHGFLISTEINVYGENSSIVVVYCRIYDEEKKLLGGQKRLIPISK